MKVVVQNYRIYVKLFIVSGQMRVLGAMHQPILATWGAVQVNDYLQAVIARPNGRVLQIGKLAIYVGLALSRLERPIPDGNTDEIEADISAHEERESR